MALLQKFDDKAATKTHGLVDANLIDVINPAVPLSTTGEVIRMATVGVASWVARGYRDNRTFGF